MGWSYTDLTAATTAPLIATVNFAAYPFNGGLTQHVIYIGIDSHIHELSWSSAGWRHDDLSLASGAPSPAPSTLGTLCPLASYAFESHGILHVFYLGADGHIHELWRDSGGWQDNDLTVAIGSHLLEVGPFPSQITFAGYSFEAQSTQHVFFCVQGGQALNNHIIELRWADQAWSVIDATAQASGPSAGGRLTGHAFPAQGTVHVFYSVNDDSAVHELWLDGGGWHDHAINSTSGLTPQVSYIDAAEGTQHVLCSGGATDSLFELWWDSDGWHTQNLSSETGAPLPVSAPAGYMFDGQGTQHAAYYQNPASSGDGHIYQLWRDSGGWRYDDLTAATGAPLANGAVFVSPQGYVFAGQGTQHVIYLAENNHLIELYWAPIFFLRPFESRPH